MNTVPNKSYGKNGDTIKISVVIPCYNGASVIERSIQSVINQTIKAHEVIIVNDSSTDDSLTIISKYTNDIVKVITHKKNKGLSCARNTGIKACTGDFIFFLDCDDWIEPNTFEIMGKHFLSPDVDIVCCGIDQVFPDGSSADYYARTFSCTGGIEALDCLAEDIMASVVWNKMYRLSCLTDSKIEFCEGTWHEDIIFTSELCLNCKKILSIDDILYHYFQHDSSFTHSKITLEKNISSYIQILKHFSYLASTYGLLNDDHSTKVFKKLVDSHVTNIYHKNIMNYLQENISTADRDKIMDVFYDRLGAPGICLSSILYKLFSEYEKQKNPASHHQSSENAMLTLYSIIKNSTCSKYLKLARYRILKYIFPGTKKEIYSNKYDKLKTSLSKNDKKK